MTDDDRFLERWSRRKTAARTRIKEPTPSVAAEPKPSPPPSTETSPSPAEIDPETLPDIESMDETSDFSVFMRDGVPEALRNRALRKLWQTDPAFNVVDGLLEYGEDYTDIAAVAEAVRSVYEVGKGMAGNADEDDAPPSGRDTPSEGGGSGETEARIAHEDGRADPMAPDAAEESSLRNSDATSTEKNAKR